MKKLKFLFTTCLLALLAALSPIQSQAQMLNIDLSLPGTLDDMVPSYRWVDIYQLQIRGNMDDTDFRVIRQMIHLIHLDLSPTNLRTLPSNALAQLRELEEVLLPSRITKIGAYAFNSCIELRAINISKEVTKIGEKAFQLCKTLKTLEIPSSVVTIDNEAFKDCTSLSKLIIKGSPKIGERAFAGCSELKTVICLDSTPPQITINAFDGASPKRILGVPAQFVDAYKADPIWSKLFVNIMPAYEEF